MDRPAYAGVRIPLASLAIWMLLNHKGLRVVRSRDGTTTTITTTTTTTTNYDHRHHTDLNLFKLCFDYDDIATTLFVPSSAAKRTCWLVRAGGGLGGSEQGLVCVDRGGPGEGIRR